MKMKIQFSSHLGSLNFQPVISPIIHYLWEWNNFSCSQSENCHLQFSPFLCSPHLLSYYLLDILPPESLPILAATVQRHSPGMSPGLQLWWSRHCFLRFTDEETEAQMLHNLPKSSSVEAGSCPSSLWWLLLFFFLIGGWLLYNIVLVSAVQKCDSAISIHVSPPCLPHAPIPCL